MIPAHILLVDDDDLFAEMARKFLSSVGHSVQRVRNGKEALKVYDPQTFNLVVTDLIMPEVEGVELILTLRRTHPAVKVIAMSGGGHILPDTYLAIARRSGAIRTLTKPFPLEELQRAVEHCLAA